MIFAIIHFKGLPTSRYSNNEREISKLIYKCNFLNGTRCNNSNLKNNGKN